MFEGPDPDTEQPGAQIAEIFPGERVGPKTFIARRRVRWSLVWSSDPSGYLGSVQKHTGGLMMPHDNADNRCVYVRIIGEPRQTCDHFDAARPRVADQC